RADRDRQGPQAAHGAADRAGREAHRRLHRALPLRSARRRSAVRRRQGRTAVAAPRATFGGAVAWRARAWRERHAACAAAFLRHASVGRRRRSARDPRIAWPCLARDHANLYRGRRRAPDRGLSQRPSTRLTKNHCSRHSGLPRSGKSLAPAPERRGSSMSEIHETIEKAQEGEHAQYFNRRIALLIAVLALFLSFSETLGKSAQTKAIDANVKSSDTWAFFQAKDIRRTTLNTAADQTALLAANVTDPTVKSAV